jgi:hypothetical protein
VASGARDVVGMRSRASGVARLETVALNSRLLVRFVRILYIHVYSCSMLMFYRRATPDARERIPTTSRAA